MGTTLHVWAYFQALLGSLGNSDLKEQNQGVDKHFHDRFDRPSLLEQNGITYHS
ncbi:hypothetical protein [Streptococcus criceti]|uniref:hypothetical protein n=1 Tax=Streptococcus criceti TaxID=1333 RepID=UPI000225E846|nr:hypothetical protein [Streptococcus criceti]